MSVRFDQPIPLPRRPGGLPDLRWPLGVAAAAGVAILLPIPGSPVALAGFVGLVVLVALFARAWLIALLPVLAVFGAHFLPLQAMEVNVFGFRLAIMLLALFSTPLTTRGGWWFNPLARFAILVLLFWLCWGLLSLFWTADVGGGLNDIIIIAVGLGLLLVLLSLDAHKVDHLDKLRFGWLLGLLAAAASAGLEIARGYPLPEDPSFQVVTSSVELGGGDSAAAIRSTLGFPSNFGGFLLLTVPFVLWSFERAKGAAKLIYLGLLALVAVLVLYSASRLALFGLVAQLVFYALVLYRRWYMLLLVAVTGLAAVSYGSLIVSNDLMIAKKLEHVEAGGDRSMAHRLALTLNGLWMAYKTAGRGIGAAAFEEEISGEVPVALPIRYITAWNAHNFWVEVLSEYGVLVFGAFMALLGWIGLLAWQAQRRRGAPAGGAGDEPLRCGRAVLVGLVGYLFYGVAGGSAMPHAVHWMFLVSLVIMAAFLREQRRTGSRRPRPALAEAGPPERLETLQSGST